jgi:hypothetical protein
MRRRTGEHYYLVNQKGRGERVGTWMGDERRCQEKHAMRGTTRHRRIIVWKASNTLSDFAGIRGANQGWDFFRVYNLCFVFYTMLFLLHPWENNDHGSSSRRIYRMGQRDGMGVFVDTGAVCMYMLMYSASGGVGWTGIYYTSYRIKETRASVLRGQRWSDKHVHWNTFRSHNHHDMTRARPLSQHHLASIWCQFHNGFHRSGAWHVYRTCVRRQVYMDDACMHA